MNTITLRTFLASLKKNLLSALQTIKKYSRKIVSKLQQKHKNNIVYTIAIGIIFLFILLNFVYLRSTEIIPISGGEYKEGVIGQPQFINPILATTDIDRALTRLIFSGLVHTIKFSKEKSDKSELNTNLTIQTDLAKSISVNNEYKDYTICIRDDAVFHDGKSVTLDDVLFTYETLKNPIFKNPLLARLQTVVISRIDEKCAVFMLENPSPEFYHLLTLGIVPKHIWGELDPESFYIPELSLKPIGSGPYKFASLSKLNANGIIKNYDLEKNERFYDKKPYIENLSFVFYNNFDQVLTALKQHEIDGLGYGIKKDFKNIKNVINYQALLPSYTAIFLNLRDSLLAQRSVRTALAHLVPKDEIIKTVLRSQATLINGPTAPTSFAYEKNVIKYEYNPQTAENVLIQDGWKKNTNGLWEKFGNVLEVKLTTSDQENLLAAAKIIQSAWQKIGIRVKLITIPSNQIAEIITTRNFQAFIYGILQSFGNDIYPLWHSSQINHPGINIAGFSNRRVDELLEKASLSYETEVRKKYYSEAQQVITQYIPAIFLYSPTYTYAVNKKIKGVEINQIIRPEDRFNRIENWYIKTKRIRNNKMISDK